MPSALASFFQKHLAQRADEVDDYVSANRARLSAAALLVETVNADGVITAEERRALLEGVRTLFSLSEGEATDLLALAESQAHEATDLHQFIVAINKQFTAEQKIELIEELWRAAYADAVLHRHEERVVRKVADLLHVSDASVLSAKYRVQTARKT